MIAIFIIFSVKGNYCLIQKLDNNCGDIIIKFFQLRKKLAFPSVPKLIIPSSFFSLVLTHQSFV